MAYLNISAAARAAGKDRGTIKRYLADGRLSSIKDATGHIKIDTSELLRVFGVLKSDGGNVAPATAADMSEDTPVYTMLQITIETLNQQLRASQEREDWLKAQLTTEQERSRELERRLLPPGDSPQVATTAAPANPPQKKEPKTATWGDYFLWGLPWLLGGVTFCLVILVVIRKFLDF